MAEKQISIVLRAKNALGDGLKSAGASLKSFGSSVVSAGKMIGGAVLAAGTAIAAFAAKAIASYTEAENATNKLSSAFTAFGENAEVNVQAIKKITAAIEEQTGVDDILLQSRAAQLRMLGVTTQEMEVALKATVALERAGLGEEAAIKAVTKAREGNFSSFEKLVPMIKSASTETEKLSLVNDFLDVSYQNQVDSLDTVTGKWTLFQDAVGDVWISIGEALSQNGAVQSGLEWMTEKVKAIGDAITTYVRSDAFVEMVYTAKMTIAEMLYRFQSLGLHIKATFQVLRDSTPIQYMTGVIGAFIKRTVEEFLYLKEWVVAIWNKIKDPLSEFKAPDMGPAKAAYDEFWAHLKGKRIEDRNHAEETINQIDDLTREHNENLKRMSEDHFLAIEEQRKKNLERERAAAAAEVVIAQQTGLSIRAIKDAEEEEDEEREERSVERKKKAAKEVVEANRFSVADLEEAWNHGYDTSARHAEKFADRAVSAAERVAEANARASSSLGFDANGRPNPAIPGGSFDVDPMRFQAIRNLQDRGLIPQNGTRVLSGMSNNWERLIYEELFRIRNQQDKLLTMN